MIYARRSLQRRLDELRSILGSDVVGKLAVRLNRAGKDRIAAMWEVAVLHGLSKCGSLQHEVVLPSKRRPDILFERDVLAITADVTAVSDEGLHQENPYRELHDLIELAKNKLGLPIGGLDLRVQSKQEITKRGARTVLRLPPRRKLHEFVEQTVVPQLRNQMNMGAFPLRIVIDEDDVGVDITVDPTKSPYSSGGYSVYNAPRIKDRNPLYNALKAKAEQLRGAGNVTGIIVGDGDCRALSGLAKGWDDVSIEQIVDEFFRQFSSVDFVLLLSVRESQKAFGTYWQPDRNNASSLFIREGCIVQAELKELFQAMIEHFPKPRMTPANGALRAFEEDYDLGYHGGYSMTGEKVRLSLREFMEIFAGLRSLEDGGAKFVKAARKLSPEPNRLHEMVLRNLKEGRLPQAINIIKTDENDDDDWVEICFGEIDPAIAPLR